MRRAPLAVRFAALAALVALAACPWPDYDFERTANAFAALFR